MAALTRRAWTRRTALALLATLGSGHAQATPRAAPTVHVQALADDVWWIAAAPGDTTADNRGAISSLLACRDGDRLWLLGSGPSPAAGHRLARALRDATGADVTDILSPWPRPELVLGQAAWPAARHWAHADVARTMRMRCPGCVERLRLGDAADDLGTDPIVVPDRLVHGERGTLGPWHWWRLSRGHDTPVTVWALPSARLITAHGLLWGDGPPDLRDAETPVVRASLARLPALIPDARWRWVPEQGPLLPASAPEEHLAYLEALTLAVSDAQSRGALETDPPAPAAGWADAHPAAAGRHALNWQHVWRKVESALFDDPAVSQRDGAFQRSLR
jgi:hypothetical protein